MPAKVVQTSGVDTKVDQKNEVLIADSTFRQL